MAKSKVLKQNRQLHLWVGLLTSVLILIEAVTGLLMSEPWLIGGGGAGGFGGGRMPMEMNGSFGFDNGSGRTLPGTDSGSSGDTGGSGGSGGSGVSSGSESSGASAVDPGADASAMTGGASDGGTAADGTGQALGNRRGLNPGAFAGGGREGGGVMGFIRQLHEGRIGNTNLKLFVDIAAIGLIVLTASGIVMSVQTLRAQRKMRRRAAAADHGSGL